MSKLKKIALGISVLLFLALGIFVFTHRKIKVELIVDGESQTVFSEKRTVNDLLSVMNVYVDSKTMVSEKGTAQIRRGMVIEVRHPNTYVVRIGEAMKTIRSFSSNVLDILQEAGFLIDEDDYAEPDFFSEVSNNSVISLYKVAFYEETVKSEVAFETLTRENSNARKGEREVITAGETGEKAESFQIRTVNGEIVDKKLISEVMTKAPINRIVEVGTREVLVASSRSSWIHLDRKKRLESGKSEERDDDKDEEGFNKPDHTAKFDKKSASPGSTIVMKATYYSTSPEENGGWTTSATGTELKRGVVAVDPNVIPLGTKLYVESLDGSPDYGYARAEDTGSAIKGNRIDLCTGSSEPAGVGSKDVRVHILPN